MLVHTIIVKYKCPRRLGFAGLPAHLVTLARLYGFVLGTLTVTVFFTVIQSSGDGGQGEEVH